MPEVNLRGIVAGAVIYMALGFLWYSPQLFGPTFLELMKFTPEQVAKLGQGMGPAYAVMAATALILAASLERLTAWAGARTAGAGIGVALLAWLPAVLTIGVSTVIFERRPLGLFLINAGYHLAAFVLIGALVAAWRKRA